MSHGEHRLLEMAMALATNPVMLLLDEPAAGLGPEETTAMVELLQELKQDKGYCWWSTTWMWFSLLLIGSPSWSAESYRYG